MVELSIIVSSEVRKNTVKKRSQLCVILLFLKRLIYDSDVQDHFGMRERPFERSFPRNDFVSRTMIAHLRKSI